MKRLFFLAMTLWFSQHMTEAQTAISVAREKVLTKQGEVIPQSIDLFPLEPGIGRVRVKPINIQNASAMRLHFRVQSAPTSNSWAVQVRDGSGRVASIISAGLIGGKDFWSDEIPGDKATVEIITISEDDPAHRLEIKIVEIARAIPPVTPESITPPNQLESIINQSNSIKTLGKSIGRLRFIGDDGGSYVCTAFLISRDLMITNNHCIRSDSEMRSALIDFDYDDVGSPQTGLRLKELISVDPACNVELDFSILRLANPVPTDRGFLQLIAAKPSQDEALLIIEHPGGEPKQISRQDCVVTNPSVVGVSPQFTDFGHKCDTKGGSSGSPVIDTNAQDPKVIGLHHIGFDTGSQLLVNRAVRIGAIIDCIRLKKPSLLTELGIP
jgi:hypothetical protein